MKGYHVELMDAVVGTFTASIKVTQQYAEYTEITIPLWKEWDAEVELYEPSDQVVRRWLELTMACEEVAFTKANGDTVRAKITAMDGGPFETYRVELIGIGAAP